MEEPTREELLEHNRKLIKVVEANAKKYEGLVEAAEKVANRFQKPANWPDGFWELEDEPAEEFEEDVDSFKAAIAALKEGG